MKLELHTGGWSGNESVIAALKRNFLFWHLCWVKHFVGGHFYFEIPMEDWNRNLAKKEYAELEAKTQEMLAPARSKKEG